MVLGAALMIYDYLFTTMLGQKTLLFGHLAGLPFAPLIAWTTADGRWLALGLGDILLATVFPLVLRKAFGRGAGTLALALNLLALGLVILFPTAQTFPVMVVLALLLIAQYTY